MSVKMTVLSGPNAKLNLNPTSIFKTLNLFLSLSLTLTIYVTRS